MTNAIGTGGRRAGPAVDAPLSALRRIATRPPPDPDVETCDMCAEVIGDEHPHVVDIASRQLMCTCRGCMLLFTAETAHLRYRAVPDRYLSFPDFDLTAAAGTRSTSRSVWRSSSPARCSAGSWPSTRARPGVAESELGLDAWSEVRRGQPGARRAHR